MLLALLAGCDRASGPRAPDPVADALLIAAGDIALCGSPADESTAELVQRLPGTVATLGDNAYPDGSARDYQQCYEPSWGRFRDRTRPSPGNHEYHTPGATGYFAYFGAAAGPAGDGYYSYDLGAWHIVSLNSNLGSIDAARQEAWLAADLRANPAPCTLAYFHHPRFSSGHHGDHPSLRPIWQILHQNGVDLVLSGHDHNYERFAPQDAQGVADPARGIRQFVVGTGGAALRAMRTPRPNSELRLNERYGALRLTLGASGYGWQFLAAPDGAVLDAGEGRCH